MPKNYKKLTIQLTEEERVSTTIKVKYNKGNSFTDYQIVDIPSWGYTITNNKDAFWDIRHSQGYINGKTVLDNVI